MDKPLLENIKGGYLTAQQKFNDVYDFNPPHGEAPVHCKDCLFVVVLDGFEGSELPMQSCFVHYSGGDLVVLSVGERIRNEVYLVAVLLTDGNFFW